MKSLQAQFQKQTQSSDLRRGEKAALRERLVQYMEYHPVLAYDTKDERTSQQTQAHALRHRFAFATNGWYMWRALSGAFVLFFVVAIPLLAEQAVPGDVLHPLKVQVNEEIRSTLAGSPYDRAAWETKRLERRVAEARILAAEGKLTPATEADLVQAVQQHSEEAQSQIATLRSSDVETATLAEMDFNTALNVQSAVLRSNGANSSSTADNPSSTAPTSELAAALQNEEAETSAVAAADTVSYERLLSRVSEEMERARSLLEATAATADEAQKQELSQKLQALQADIAIATELHEEDSETAREILRATIGRAQKVVAFMTDIEVRSTVSLDTLVPAHVELTEAQLARIKQKYSQAQENLDHIDTLLSNSTNAAVTAEAENITLRVQTMLASTTERLQSTSSDIALTQRLVSNALTVSQELHMQLQSMQTADTNATPRATTTSSATTSDNQSIDSNSTTTASTTTEEDNNSENTATSSATSTKGASTSLPVSTSVQNTDAVDAQATGAAKTTASSGDQQEAPKRSLLQRLRDIL